MNSEERWAQQKEWDNERGEIEIKQAEALAPTRADICQFGACHQLAVMRFWVGEVGKKGTNIDIDLCAQHTDEETAIDLYSVFKERD